MKSSRLKLCALPDAGCNIPGEVLAVVAEEIVVGTSESLIHPLDGIGFVRDPEMDLPRPCVLEPADSQPWRSLVNHHWMLTMNIRVTDAVPDIKDAVVEDARLLGWLT